MRPNSEFATVVVNGEEREVRIGTRLSELVEIPLPCGGHGKCGKCKVVASGTLSEPTPSELHTLSKEELADGIRLACHTTVAGDCRVDAKQSTAKNNILTQTALASIRLSPAFSAYGAAVDIGTTTLAATLFDTNGREIASCGRMNPQATWGADVISRIEASLRGEGAEMATCILRALDEMLTELAETAKISVREIDAAVLTGNTAMLHLLTDTSVEPLSHAPFEAHRLFGETLHADAIGLTVLSPDAEVYLPSCISAFVGADTVCALLATELCEKDDSALLADIGTNGEMGLWHGKTLTVCSTAAGPAFEGVGISMGMSGATGAIDRVTPNGDTWVAHVIGEGTPKGICGSGLVDAISCLLKAEVLDETGYLEDDPVTVLSPVVLTQQDVRMVQLAKSAICAGICTLLKDAGITAERVTALSIAGGFGSYLNMKSAAEIGLIPPALAEKVNVVGNAALTGAAMLLLNRELRADAACLAQNAKVLDLASNPVFADLYMEGMMFD